LAGYGIYAGTFDYPGFSDPSLHSSKYLIQTEQRYKYSVVAFFGLIHGLGFSNYLQSLLGAESSIFAPLFAFNVGLEIGQIIVVAAILTSSILSLHVLKWKQTAYIQVISGITIGLVLSMILERWP
jgi:hypothetical protein